MGTRVAAHCPDKSLAGVPRLLEDLQRLADDHESADIVFLVGREEAPVYAHRVVLMARCKSFQTPKRGEMCRIPGCTVSPSVPGTPTPIRLPHFQPETFRQFIIYVYTGKIILQDNGVFEMLTVAQELGVDELRISCEDHVTSTLSVLNACTFLAAAMEIQERASVTFGDPANVCAAMLFPPFPCLWIERRPPVRPSVVEFEKLSFGGTSFLCEGDTKRSECRTKVRKKSKRLWFNP